jgi:catechol 2,3-dioxygenase-like lactoylglutathione lyase family enzyme
MRPVGMLKAHVAIYVKDAAASVDFYRKLFGIEPAKMALGYAKFDMQNPPLNFTLNERSGSLGGGLSHMGIQVGSTEDVLATRDKWREAGLATRDEMKIDCCHALQDKTWVKDPDGNEWEVFVVLRDSLAKKTTDEQESCCAPTCCAAMPAA